MILSCCGQRGNETGKPAKRWVAMSVRSFSELGALFANQSTDLWERLGYVRESYKSRGDLGPVRFGEETITDLLMMDLYVQGSKLAHFKQTSKQEFAPYRAPAGGTGEHRG